MSKEHHSTYLFRIKTTTTTTTVLCPAVFVSDKANANILELCRPLGPSGPPTLIRYCGILLSKNANNWKGETRDMQNNKGAIELNNTNISQALRQAGFQGGSTSFANMLMLGATHRQRYTLSRWPMSWSRFAACCL